jgi:hypothetical protein
MHFELKGKCSNLQVYVPFFSKPFHSNYLQVFYQGQKEALFHSKTRKLVYRWLHKSQVNCRVVTGNVLYTFALKFNRPWTRSRSAKQNMQMFEVNIYPYILLLHRYPNRRTWTVCSTFWSTFWSAFWSTVELFAMAAPLPLPLPPLPWEAIGTTL